MFKHLYEKATKGFSYKDMWNLDVTIAKFILPRLKYFRNMERSGYPVAFKSQKNWDKEIDKMIWSLEEVIYEKNYPFYDTQEPKRSDVEKYYKKLNDGLESFGKNFARLWD